MADHTVKVLFDPEPIERRAALTRWLWAVPHLVVTGLAAVAGVAVAVVIGVAVAATGRRPTALASFQAWAVRERVRCFSYFFLLRADRPPFAALGLEDDGADPLTEVSCRPAATVPRWSPFVRLAVVLPRIAVGVPIGLVLDVLYPVEAVVVALRRGWTPRVGAAVAATEAWVAHVFLYAYLATDDRPPLLPDLAAAGAITPEPPHPVPALP